MAEGARERESMRVLSSSFPPANNIPQQQLTVRTHSQTYIQEDCDHLSLSPERENLSPFFPPQPSVWLEWRSGEDGQSVVWGDEQCQCEERTKNQLAGRDKKWALRIVVQRENTINIHPSVGTSAKHHTSREKRRSLTSVSWADPIFASHTRKPEISLLLNFSSVKGPKACANCFPTHVNTETVFFFFICDFLLRRSDLLVVSSGRLHF